MKTPLPLALAASFAAVATAAEPGLPEFNSRTLASPPLSLQEVIKSPPPLQFFSAPAPRPAALHPAPAREPRITRDGGMPILTPDPKIDYKMVVKAPDPTVDFKLIVKSPGGETSK